MSYLEKKPWKKVKFSPESKGIQKVNLWEKLRLVTIVSAAFLLVGIMTGNHLLQHTGSYFDSYKGVCGLAYATAPDKPLNFRITKRENFANFVKGIFSFGDTISIVKKGNGEKLGTDLDALRFAGYNVAMSYLNYPATDWVSQSRLLKIGKKMTEVVGSENLAMAFQIIPYGQFKVVTGNVHNVKSHMMEPFLKLDRMQGLEKGFKRKFADGQTRLVKPEDTWLCLRPNTHGMWRKNRIDLELGAPSVEPEESLPVAFYSFSNLCDHKTGQWDIEKTQWVIARNYAISYGIYIEPSAIEIIGKGLQTRFIYKKKLDVEHVIVHLAKNQLDPKWEFGKKNIVVGVPVSVTNSNHELCFWGSHQPDQSIIIPFSYLFRMEDDDPILLADGAVDITMQDILDEIQQVRKNRQGQNKKIYASRGNSHNSHIGYDFSPYVTKTARLTQIADKIIGDAQTPQEAEERQMKFIVENLPYVSDHKGDKSKPGYNGPIEIPMSPLVALFNRGEDCEGHAISGAAYFVASEHPTLRDINNVFALVSLDYGSIGHVVPLLPIWHELVTDPFPNHVLFPINGKRIVLAYTEPTGFGYNDMHQDKPQKRGYLPEYATVVQVHGEKRTTSIIGFNQFEHVQKSVN
ncbi:MAG: hypothetical protein U9O20_00500 [Patescibacteria group bacterium]|nr:hypothetical protein [Patescibacteria group bacterium]